MKRWFTWGVVLLLGASMASAATLKEIIAKNLETRGGEAKLRAIQTLKITGKSSMGGMEVPMVMYQKRPNMIRMEITIQQQTIVQAYDGKTAWWIMPFMNIFEPQPMPEKEAKNFLDNTDLDIDSPFIDYEKKNYKLKLLGEDEYEGTPVYKIKLTRPNGREFIYYLDKETGIELRVTTEQVQKGQTITVQTVFGDYKEVDGILFPFSLQFGSSGQSGFQFTITDVQVNPKLDDSLFKLPAKTPSKP